MHSSIEHACLVYVCLLLLGVSPFLNLLHICYHSFLGIKATTEFDSCRLLQSCYFVIINTYCVYMKIQGNTLHAHLLQRIWQFDTLDLLQTIG